MMNETSWLSCLDPGEMQKVLVDRNASHRKLRLFAVACCRTISHLVRDEAVRKALEAAERYAEGRIGESMAMKWYRRALRRRPGLSDPAVQWTAEYLACGAVSTALCRVEKPFGLRTHGAVAETLAATTVNQPNTRKWTAAVRSAVMPLSHLLRDVFGNPFRPATLEPAWRTDTALALSREMYESRDFFAMPILADALEDAGCADEQLLGHCRDPSPHARGCWVVDLMLGKG